MIILLFCIPIYGQARPRCGSEINHSTEPAWYQRILDQEAIIGRWGLVKSISGETPVGYITQTCSPIDILILEFKDDNVLTVYCMRKDNNCGPWEDGDYPYFFHLNQNNRMQIGNIPWSFKVSEKELMMRQGADGASYYFERM